MRTILVFVPICIVDKVWALGIFILPCLLGIGSPCGSLFGLPSFLLIFSKKMFEIACSKISASACTWSQEYCSSSTK